MEEKLKKLFKRDNLVVLVLLGVLIFIAALPVSEKKEVTQEEEQIQPTGQAKELLVEHTQQQDYAEYLEQRLKETLSTVSGVGKVEVMLTLQASEELVVEKDEPSSRSNTTETDSTGGSRVVTQWESSETTIYRTQDGDSTPYVVKTLLPRVEGVLVVAQGAGSGEVNKNITAIAQALFGVEAHKVQVVKMKNE